MCIGPSKNTMLIPVKLAIMCQGSKSTWQTLDNTFSHEESTLNVVTMKRKLQMPYRFYPNKDMEQKRKAWF